MKKYEWKLKSFAKGIDPDLAVKELERIESIYGALTPENILNESQKEDAVLHPLFEWADDQAASKYRLQQARQILNNVVITVIHDGQPRQIAVYEVVNLGEDRSYKNIESMSPNDVEYVKKATIRELNSLKAKLSVYKDFEKTIRHIDDALESIQ